MEQRFLSPEENLKRKGEMKLKSCVVVKRALFQQSTLDQLDRGKPINIKCTVAYGLKKNVFVKSRYGPCVRNNVNNLSLLYFYNLFKLSLFDYPYFSNRKSTGGQGDE